MLVDRFSNLASGWLVVAPPANQKPVGLKILLNYHGFWHDNFLVIQAPGKVDLVSVCEMFLTAHGIICFHISKCIDMAHWVTSDYTNLLSAAIFPAISNDVIWLTRVHW